MSENTFNFSSFLTHHHMPRGIISNLGTNDHPNSKPLERLTDTITFNKSLTNLGTDFVNIVVCKTF
jgi:hypothetical protein